jgi:deazaflavin-dependent oxidoreductase (nitroreductase family)
VRAAVASRSAGRLQRGGDRAPAWLHNLRANAAVEIEIIRVGRTATAIVVEPSDPDYSHLWKIVKGNNHDRYSDYQKLTARATPVFVVRPT